MENKLNEELRNKLFKSTKSGWENLDKNEKKSKRYVRSGIVPCKCKCNCCY